MKKEHYRVVIVGFAHVHVNEVAGHFFRHPRIRLCAAADIPPLAPERRPGAVYTREWNIANCANQFGLRLYADWKQMLSEEEPDLCILNSENCHHPMVAEECARLGIGLCIEKPMAASLSDALRIYRAVKAQGSFCMVNWPITWNPGLHTLKQMADAGCVGRILEVKTRMGHTGPLGPGANHRLAENAEPMTEAERCATWWHQHSLGGGAMADYCCYGSLLSRWIIGQDAVAAWGIRCNAQHTLGDAEDNAAMLVRYPGCYAVLEGTWTTYDHTFHSPIVYGTGGALVCDYKSGQVRWYKPDHSVEDINIRPLPEQYRNAAWAYVHHMDTGEPLHCTNQPEFNLAAMAILDAGIRSASSGMLEPVNPPRWQIG